MLSALSDRVRFGEGERNAEGAKKAIHLLYATIDDQAEELRLAYALLKRKI